MEQQARLQAQQKSDESPASAPLPDQDRAEQAAIRAIQSIKTKVSSEAAAQDAERDSEPVPLPALPPKSFRKKHRVTTDVLIEETGQFEQRETDADSALIALAEDLKALKALRLCIAGV